jgi:predicted dehydrogenase
MRKIGVGLIGLHNWYHAYPIGEYLKKGIQNLELIAVSDEREKYAKLFAKQYEAKAWYTNYEDLLNRPDIDAIIITAYTTSHSEIAVAAAERGKHILCDKPIEATLEKADKMVKAARKAGVKFMMLYPLRFIPAYVKAKELITQGVIGKPVSAFHSIRVPLSYVREAPDATQPGWYVNPAMSGGGAFIDHGIHYADSLRWFLESDVDTVVAKIANLTYKDIKVEDYGIALLTFKNGAIATIESTWHTSDWYGPLSSPELCIVTGTEGELVLHYQKSPQLEVAGRIEPLKGRIYFDWGGEERYEISYKRILEHFANCIIEDKEPKVTGEDGKIALEICLAAYESAKRKEFIKLPLKY